MIERGRHGGERGDDELVRLLDLSLDLFCVAGLDGSLRWVNKAFVRALGYSREELMVRPYLEFVHPEDVQATIDVLAELADGNDLIGFTARSICADGSVRWLEWNTRTMPGEGLVLSVGRDVTDRRLAEGELRDAHRLVETSRNELRVLAEEQAALRRVATLVAQSLPPDDLFATVAEEVARVMHVPRVTVSRYESDDTASVLASFSERGPLFAAGAPVSLDGTNVLRLVRESCRPARIDDWSGLEGEIAEAARGARIRSSVGTPIVVAGRLWGAIVASSRDPEVLPDDAEGRLMDFTELVATAIANTQAREQLRTLADEQAALRRVATLVARGVRPAEIFSAVSEEVGRLFGSGAAVLKFEHDSPAVVFVGPSTGVDIPIGTRWEFQDGMASAEVYRTGRSARVDAMDWSSAGGPVGAAARRLGVLSTVVSPIVVERRLWGGMSVSSSDKVLPLGAEERLEKFTELVATAIANAESREALARLAEEQATLRRVATLVAGAAPLRELFEAVAEEVGRLLPADIVLVGRYDADGGVSGVGGWGRTGDPRIVGTRASLGGRNVSTLVFQTRRPARIDAYTEASGAVATEGLAKGVTSAVGVPITVAGRLWGLIVATSTHAHVLPAGTESRLAGFTELVATAIANAEARAELRESRTRIVATADETRRRIERDLHDGAQQRLVALAVQLRGAQSTVPPELDELAAELDRVAAGLTSALNELREYARGIHPAILAEGGLGPALRSLARRSAVPVNLTVRGETSLPERIELGAYYVVSEALTNAAKHANASAVHVAIDAVEGDLRLSVRDDGVGGADFAGGSGLAGLKDRVEALGGRISVKSPPGMGTSIEAELPIAVGDTADSGE